MLALMAGRMGGIGVDIVQKGQVSYSNSCGSLPPNRNIHVSGPITHGTLLVFAGHNSVPLLHHR